MAQVTLAGTPAIRYPDPLVPLVAPNGTQSISAYSATFFYYDPRPDDPALAGYVFILTGVPKTKGESLESLFGFQTLLFGMDYPALVQTTSTYLGDAYTSDGNIYPIKLPTFDESALPILGNTIPNFTFLLQDGYTPILTKTDTYKKIFTGKTITNSVQVSGFPLDQGYADHGLYAQFAPPAEPTTLSPLVLTMNVLTNTPVVSSVNTHTSIYINPADPIPQIKNTIPIILWEPNLTQEIVDNDYIIEDTVTACGQSTLQVVGIWNLSGYSPLYVPPASPMRIGAMADGDGAQPSAPPVSELAATKASLLQIATRRLLGIREQLTSRR